MAATPPSVFSQPLEPTSSATASAKDGLDTILRSPENEDPRVRKVAIEKLAWVENPQPAVPHLRRALKDTDPIVRATAARALWEIDPNTSESVPVLIELLNSQNNNQRELAAYFLGPIGKAARPAIPSLRSALVDRDPSMRIHAAEALAQIDPTGTEAVDVLVKAMKHADSNVRSLAAMAFGNVDPSHAERVVPVLMAAVVDSDPAVRTSAELSLPTFNLDVSHSGQQLLPEPVERKHPLADVVTTGDPVPTVENTSPFVSNEPPVQVEDAYANMSPELNQAVRDLSQDNPAVCRSALDRIAWMGSAAEPVIPEVIACLNDPHPGIRAYAAKTLWDLDKQSGLAAINTLRDLLDST
ncbi:MAG: HEAT repeat domain-containing protein, partial [Planctomycetaceae bacterium]|nr:HEAT repeat domain-containing protein [Planctomycetaceae bacterium]